TRANGRRQVAVPACRGRGGSEVERVGSERAEVGAPPQLDAAIRVRQALGDRQRAPALFAGPRGLVRAAGLGQGAPARGHAGAMKSGRRPPTEPSIWSWISRFISTAYSIGSSFTIGSMKPATIMASASSFLIPRLCK